MTGLEAKNHLENYEEDRQFNGIRERDGMIDDMTDQTKTSCRRQFSKRIRPKTFMVFS